MGNIEFCEKKNKTPPLIKKREDFQFRKIENGTNDEQVDQISVLSYNILAKMFTSDSWHRLTKKEFLDFEYRKKRVIEIIKQLDADVICLQEVDQFEQFYKKALDNLGYSVYFQPMTPYTEKQLQSELLQGLDYYGLIIGVKKQKYEILNKIDHIYAKNIPECLNLNAFEYRRESRVISLTVKDKSSGKIVNILNTHFFWDPKYDHVKYFQMHSLMEYVEQNFSENDNIIICGDYNSLPNSNCLNFILDQKEPLKERTEFSTVKIKDCEKLYQSWKDKGGKMINFQSAYSDYRNNQKPPLFTNYTEKFKGTLDYIFYNKNLEREFILELQKEEDILEYGQSCPNEFQPSDHLPIMAKFNFKN